MADTADRLSDARRSPLKAKLAAIVETDDRGLRQSPVSR